jgi:hypothetical protein
LWNGFSRLLTLGTVLLGWVFFRASSWTTATGYIGRMAHWSHDGTRFVSPYILAAVMGVVLAHLLVQKDSNWAHEVPTRSWPVRSLAYGALIFLLVCLGATDAAPFIYFQF